MIGNNLFHRYIKVFYNIFNIWSWRCTHNAGVDIKLTDNIEDILHTIINSTLWNKGISQRSVPFMSCLLYDCSVYKG